MGVFIQVSLGCLEISFNYITCIAVSIPVPPKEVLLFPLRFKGFRTWQASLLPWMRMVQWLGAHGVVHDAVNITISQLSKRDVYSQLRKHAGYWGSFAL